MRDVASSNVEAADEYLFPRSALCNILCPDSTSQPFEGAKQILWTIRDCLPSMQVCLIGKDGNAVLHRIPPLNDPAETEQEAIAICQVHSHSFLSLQRPSAF